MIGVCEEPIRNMHCVKEYAKDLIVSGQDGQAVIHLLCRFSVPDPKVPSAWSFSGSWEAHEGCQRRETTGAAFYVRLELDNRIRFQATAKKQGSTSE